MKYVYILEAVGWDGLVGSSWRTIRTSTCFATKELAESRIAAFEERLIETGTLECCIKITVIGLELIST